MKLLVRILAAPVVAVAFLVGVGLSGHLSMRALTSEFETLRDQKLSAAHALGEWQTRMAGLNAELYRTIIQIESLDPKAIEATRKKMVDETTMLSAGMTALAGKVDSGAREQLLKAVAEVGKFQGKATNALSVAESSPAAATSILAAAERSFKSAFTALQAVAKDVDEDVKTMSEQVSRVSARGTLATVALTLIAVFTSMALAVWNARKMVRSIDVAVQISEAVARGELDVQVPTGDNDEVGRLLRSLGGTVQRLGQSLDVIRQASASINTAASEIAAGSNDLSNRTELTASGLQSTSGAMDDMSGKLKLSAEHTQHMHGLAQSATDVANRGSAVVAEVVATMQEIHVGTRRIEDITGVIDGIAFQTNILALNAAVEAARAGEQGRGFAVVASEVRALSQRSATAAKEIKSLLAASGQKAEGGAALAGQAQVAVSEIMAAVRRVGDTIAVIDAAVTEHSTTIRRVNDEMAQLDNMTQENSALVEESAAASESLKEQSARLQEVLGGFRLPASTPAP